MEEKNLTFFEHLGELRRALLISALAVLVGLVIGVAFSDYLDWAVRQPIAGLLPAGSDQMVFLGVFEPIFYRLKLGLVGGLLVASPVVFWQLWWFISPGLYPKERKLALPFIFLASAFFIGGAAFCYFVVLPKAVAFSVGQMTDNTRIMLSVQSYLSSAAMFLLAFGLVFETPLLVFLLCWLGVTTPRALGKYRKYILLGSFIIAAILTPTPDVLNQAIMAVPLYVLFELGLAAARLLPGRKPPDQPAAG